MKGFNYNIYNIRNDWKINNFDSGFCAKDRYINKAFYFFERGINYWESPGNDKKSLYIKDSFNTPYIFKKYKA